MAQDFAKKRQARGGARKTSRSAANTGSQGETGWSWFFSGLFCGLFVAFIAFLAYERPERSAAQTTATDSETVDTAPERGNFDFYQYLPEAEVQVDVVPVALREAPEDDTDQYLLQAGSFQDRQDAEGRRASVILLNMDAQVVPGIVAGKTWHRVQVGPFTGRSAAEDARATLSSNNIDTIVLRVR